MPRHSLASQRRIFILIAVGIALVYSNSLDGSWHLDDFDRIVKNRSVQVAEFSPEVLTAFFQEVWQAGWLQRPLAYTSLAMNWYMDGDRTFGYHFFNIAIHLLGAFFLYRVGRSLFDTPRLRGVYTPDQADFISLLAAFLWALNPIQTQAVTYIIQRMAAMCSMFFILAIHFYLNGRMDKNWRSKIKYFIYCLLSFAGAFFSKENAATLPLALVLVEAVFFRDLSRRKTRLFFTILALAVLGAGLAGGAMVFFGGDVLSVLNYGDRPFTAWERLLSQPRALMLYLSLIFYPTPTRLSITHDFEVSTSLFHPWTTLPSLLVVVGLITLALWRMRRWPLVSFAILFFFLNQAVESSVIGLEMVFEHRNHLPSMFLFLPVAAGIVRLMGHFRARSRVVTVGLWLFVPFLLVGFGTGTYIRNQAWESEKSLWEDALAKAPGESRPYHMLAGHHYDRIGDIETSMRLYHLSLGRRLTRVSHAALIYNNMAALHYSRKDYAAASECWNKAVEIHPDYRLGRYHLALALVRLGRFEDALAQVEKILEDRPDYFAPRNLQGIILLHQGKHVEALSAFRRCLKTSGQNRSILLNIGAALYYLEDYPQAALYFREALRMVSRDRVALAWLGQTYLRDGAARSADDAIARLLATAPVDELNAWLESCNLSSFGEDDVVAPEVDEIFLERLGMACRKTVARTSERPLVASPGVGPVE